MFHSKRIMPTMPVDAFDQLCDDEEAARILNDLKGSSDTQDMIQERLYAYTYSLRSGSWVDRARLIDLVTRIRAHQIRLNDFQHEDR